MTHDILVSYVSRDKEWGEWIAAVLRDTKSRIATLEDGSINAAATMAGALTWSRRVVPVLSSASLGSNEEVYWQMWCAADPQAKLRRVVPVQIEPCTLTGILGEIVPVDLCRRPMANTGTAAHLLERMRALMGG